MSRSAIGFQVLEDPLTRGEMSPGGHSSTQHHPRREGVFLNSTKGEMVGRKTLKGPKTDAGAAGAAAAVAAAARSLVREFERQISA